MSPGNKLTEQQLFDQLISSLVHSSWVFLGKIKNPINDQLEKDLDQATIQIDMLEMLHKRMKGNLSQNEDQYLDHLVRELKMNFVEEKNKKTENKMPTGRSFSEGEKEGKGQKNKLEEESRNTNNGVDKNNEGKK